MTAAVLRLKVTLDDVEPKVLRRIEVPADIKLDRLHLTLQAALGWTNSHLFEIRARDTGWGIPSPDWPDGPLDARKAKLIDVIEDAGCGHENAALYLRLRRLLGAHNQGRADDRGRSQRNLSAPGRGVRPLSARRRRRTLGLRRNVGGDRRPRT